MMEQACWWERASMQGPESMQGLGSRQGLESMQGLGSRQGRWFGGGFLAQRSQLEIHQMP